MSRIAQWGGGSSRIALWRRQTESGIIRRAQDINAFVAEQEETVKPILSRVGDSRWELWSAEWEFRRNVCILWRQEGGSGGIRPRRLGDLARKQEAWRQNAARNGGTVTTHGGAEGGRKDIPLCINGYFLPRHWRQNGGNGNSGPIWRSGTIYPNDAVLPLIQPQMLVEIPTGNATCDHYWYLPDSVVEHGHVFGRSPPTWSHSHWRNEW